MARYDEVGLEMALGGAGKLMAGTKPKGGLDDGGTVAKIAAVIYYQSSVISEISKSSKLKTKYVDLLFNQIGKDLGAYIDMQARSKPKELHHVYEWKRVGVPISRLFKINKTNSDGYGLTFGLELRQSKTSVPNAYGKKYIFKNKAFVMESGKPVTISPRQAERLVFEIGGKVIFMGIGRSVRVAKPGGKMVAGSVVKHYKKFVSGGMLKASMDKSGADKMMRNIVYKAMRVPSIIRIDSYSYSPSAVKNSARAAVNGGVGF